MSVLTGGDVVRTVWIEQWQMQCCGEPFEVGDAISWTTTTTVDRDFLAALVGKGAAQAVTHVGDSHQLDDGPLGTTAGIVKAIQAVFCRAAMQDGALYPVAGTERIEEKRQADGWEEETEGHRFYGYLVSIV